MSLKKINEETVEETKSFTKSFRKKDLLEAKARCEKKLEIINERLTVFE